MEFPLPHGKTVTVDFEGGHLSSNGGALILKALDDRLKLSTRLAACLNDHRDPSKTQHSLVDLFRTRLFLIGLGYEDCLDANFLREDPVVKTALDRLPESGLGLPSQSTLSRFEHGLFLEEGLRWKDLYRMSEVFVTLFVEKYQATPPRLIVLEPDATDDPTHGGQQLSFFNGFYDSHCYVPLYVYAKVDDEEGHHLLAAVLRPGNIHASFRALALVKRIVSRLRAAFPGVQIVFRADAGFALPAIYTWCEEADVEYVIGLPKNPRVLGLGEPFLQEALACYEEIGEKVRVFGEFAYQAETWETPRRVVMKAEVLPKGENPRFVVTNVRGDSPQAIYEFYVDRGDMENRIKEMKLDLRAGRTSCCAFKANQFRLLLHAACSLLYQELKGYLKQTDLAKAQVGSLCVQLLKVAAWVKESVRRVWVRCSSHFRFKELFAWVLLQLRSSPG